MRRYFLWCSLTSYSLHGLISIAVHDTQVALKEHMDNEFLRRRKELDMVGVMRAANLAEYDASMIVPMWGYKDVKVRA